MLYDERRWQEMFVAPRSAVVPVIVPEQVPGMERYFALGRTAYAEPLEHQGTVEAADDGAAAEAALDRFGDRWVELVLVPERVNHWVVGGG